MSNSSNPLTTCPECGADDAPAGGRCWLCHAAVPGEALLAEPKVYEAQLAPEPPRHLVGEIFAAVALIAMLVVLVLMGIGIAVEDTGMLIPFLIVVTPALVATASRGLAQRTRGQTLSWSQRLVTFVLSGAVTVGVLFLLTAALIAAFFVYCIVAMSQMGYP